MILIVMVIICIYCEAGYGSKTNLRTLTVEPLNHDSEETYLMAGDSKKVSCKANVWTNRRVEWYTPSGELVKNFPGGRVSVQEHFIPEFRTKAQIPTLVLTITRASVEDTGIWECRYGNHVDVAKYRLCVIDPTEFVDTPSNVSLDEGRSISLTCQTTGNPEPTMVWYKDGDKIYEDFESKKYTIGVKYSSHWIESFLTIKAVGPDDVGVYTCEAHQDHILLEGCSAVTRHNISMKVNYAPYFEDDENNVYLFSKNNERVTLKCPANGDPKPMYRWFQVLQDGTFTELSRKQIAIPGDGSQWNMSVVTSGKLWEIHGHIYKCLANNRYGEATRHFTLLKLQKPREPTLIYVSNVTVDRVDFNISWDPWKYAFPVDAYEIEYKPRASTSRGRFISIFLEPRVVINDMVTSITISLQVEPDTEYSVRFSLQNEAGATPWSHRLDFETEPKIEEMQEETTTTSIPQQLKFEDEPFFSNGVIAGIALTVTIVFFAATCITIIKKL